jgi:hypothetical protein
VHLLPYTLCNPGRRVLLSAKYAEVVATEARRHRFAKIALISRPTSSIDGHLPRGLPWLTLKRSRSM